MANQPELSYCADLVRRDDHDRFLTALFAPAGRREDLFALYAFNIEVARTREMVREPMMGLIRLQWWRESIDGIYDDAVRHHAVVQPLAAAVGRHELSRAHFNRLLDARETDMDDRPPPTVAALLDYAEATSSSLVLLALEILSGNRGAAGEGRTEPALAVGHDVGIAWALAGLLRAIPFHARAKRLYLPEELTTRAGLRTGDLFELRPSPELAAVVRELADIARTHLEKARTRQQQMPRRLLPAVLPAVLADLYLGKLAKADYNVFHDEMRKAAPARAWRLAFNAFRGRY